MTHDSFARVLRTLTAILIVVGLGAFAPAAATDTDTNTDTDTDTNEATATDYGRMLLVLDSSGSMAEPAGGGTTKIEAAKQALGDVIDSLPEEAYVGLRVYGTEVFSRDQPGACRDSVLVVPPGVDNRPELTAAVGDYEPYGETPIGYALQQAAKDIGSEGTRSIVLVSDGVATCEPDPCDVAAEIAEQGIDLQIDVVGLSVDATAESQLRCIASAGNGSYYEADSAAEIVESLSTVSSRALRPFELEGAPIEGGPSSDPTRLEVGRWTDQIGDTADTSERWFTVERTMPGSTLHLGASSLGAGDKNFATLWLQTSLPDGTSCASDIGVKQLITGKLAGVGVVIGDGPADLGDECAEADRVLVKVSRTRESEVGETAFGLTVAEEPPVDASSLPGAIDESAETFLPPDLSGAPQPVVGGSSFGDAKEVTAGRYAATMVPGETQVFRVRAEYGQTISARVLVPAASPALREQVGSSLGPFAHLDLFNPFRMAMTTLGEGTTPADFASAAMDRELAVGTTEVRFNNRDDDGNTAYTAGDYYLVYSSDEDRQGGTYEMPFTLEVDVTGEKSGAPTYPDGQTLLTQMTTTTEVSDPGSESTVPESQVPESTAPELTEQQDPSSAADPGGPDSADTTPVLLVGGLLLVAMVCLGLGVLTLRRSRG